MEKREGLGLGKRGGGGWQRLCWRGQARWERLGARAPCRAMQGGQSRILLLILCKEARPGNSPPHKGSTRVAQPPLSLNGTCHLGGGASPSVSQVWVWRSWGGTDRPPSRREGWLCEERTPASAKAILQLPSLAGGPDPPLQKGPFLGTGLIGGCPKTSTPKECRGLPHVLSQSARGGGRPGRVQGGWSPGLCPSLASLPPPRPGGESCQGLQWEEQRCWCSGC